MLHMIERAAICSSEKRHSQKESIQCKEAGEFSQKESIQCKQLQLEHKNKYRARTADGQRTWTRTEKHLHLHISCDGVGPPIVQRTHHIDLHAKARGGGGGGNETDSPIQRPRGDRSPRVRRGRLVIEAPRRRPSCVCVYIRDIRTVPSTTTGTRREKRRKKKQTLETKRICG